MLWEIYTEQGGNSDYFTNFIEVSGCPFEPSITYIKETENILEEFDSEMDPLPMFAGDLRNCAIDYISRFDNLPFLKVYDFLEAYNLSYDLYDKAVHEFNELAQQQDFAY